MEVVVVVAVAEGWAAVRLGRTTSLLRSGFGSSCWAKELAPPLPPTPPLSLMGLVGLMGLMALSRPLSLPQTRSLAPEQLQSSPTIAL